MIVRPARLDDAAAVGDLHVRSWQAAYRGIVPDAILDRLSVEGRHESCARTIALASAEPSRDGRIFVVEDRRGPLPPRVNGTNGRGGPDRWSGAMQRPTGASSSA